MATLSVIVLHRGNARVDRDAVYPNGSQGYQPYIPAGELANLAPGTPVWVERVEDGKAFGRKAEGVLITQVGAFGRLGLGGPGGGSYLPGPFESAVNIPAEVILGEAEMTFTSGGYWSDAVSMFVDRRAQFRHYYLLDPSQEGTEELVIKILAGAARITNRFPRLKEGEECYAPGEPGRCIVFEILKGRQLVRAPLE